MGTGRGVVCRGGDGWVGSGFRVGVVLSLVRWGLMVEELGGPLRRRVRDHLLAVILRPYLSAG